jgi:hypothetical protein
MTQALIAPAMQKRYSPVIFCGTFCLEGPAKVTKAPVFPGKKIAES